MKTLALVLFFTAQVNLPCAFWLNLSSPHWISWFTETPCTFVVPGYCTQGYQLPGWLTVRLPDAPTWWDVHIIRVDACRHLYHGQ